MAWWGAAAGAGVGGFLGGPLGALAGGALGSAIDALLRGESSTHDLGLDVEVLYDDVPDGRLIVLVPGFDPSALAGFACHFVDVDGDYVAGRRSFKDEDGDFVAYAWFNQETESARVFVPVGALDCDAGDEVALVLTAVDQDAEWLGETTIPMEWSVAGRYSATSWLRPLIDLARVVAVSDGRLTPDESSLLADVVRTEFRLSSVETREVERELARPVSVDVDESVDQLLMRFPQVSPWDVLALLADIAKCDQVVTPAEADVLMKVAISLGMEPAEWPEVAEELGIRGVGLNLLEAYKCLGLEEHATMQEVKLAYRRLIRDYHPDTVASLPEGFQEYATTRTTEICRAYEVIVGVSASAEER